jgi:hypothetical protein
VIETCSSMVAYKTRGQSPFRAALQADELACGVAHVIGTRNHPQKVRMAQHDNAKHQRGSQTSRQPADIFEFLYTKRFIQRAAILARNGN